MSSTINLKTETHPMPSCTSPKRICQWGFAALILALVAVPVFADEPFPAHRVAGNTYYVGSRDLATYLITTPEGHILINSGFEETVPMIRGAVESLGFKMRDVKYLLASHAHSDHVAGHALLKELTGAKVLVMKGDDEVIRSGGVGQYLYTDNRWTPCPVDRVLADGEEVKLGGVTLTARKTPGHTRGCTTWTWQVTDGDKKYQAVMIGSPNVNPGYQLVGNQDYPEIADDFAKTFAILKSLPCDLFLGAHGKYYGMIEKYERLKTKPGENLFVDPKGYMAYVLEREEAYRAKLGSQQSQAKSGDQQAAIALLRKKGAVITETGGVATSVQIKDTEGFTDEDFQALGRLTNVKMLTTSGEELNDRTLGFLTGMAALEDMSTNAAQLTDEGLSQFMAFRNLKQLKFFHTSLKRKDFKGTGFEYLAEHMQLRRLTVAGCPFNDEGMAAVGKLKQLENFRTWHTYQTEAGNVHLKGLTNLKSLHLGQRLRHYDGTSNAWSVSDETLTVLSELKSLDTLLINESRLSLAALSKLKMLPNLKRLELDKIDIPTADVEVLKKELPRVTVVWKPLTQEDRVALDRILKQ